MLGKNQNPKFYFCFYLFSSLLKILSKRKIPKTKKNRSWTEAQLSFLSFPFFPFFRTSPLKARPSRPFGFFLLSRTSSHAYVASLSAVTRERAVAHLPCHLTTLFSLYKATTRAPPPTNPRPSSPFPRAATPSLPLSPAASPRESTREHQPHHQPEEFVVAMG